MEIELDASVAATSESAKNLLSELFTFVYDGDGHVVP